MTATKSPDDSENWNDNLCDIFKYSFLNDNAADLPCIPEVLSSNNDIITEEQQFMEIANSSEEKKFLYYINENDELVFICSNEEQFFFDVGMRTECRSITESTPMTSIENVSPIAMDSLDINNGPNDLPMSIDPSQNHTFTDSTVFALPEIKILIQPMSKTIFRYKSEMTKIFRSICGEKNDTSIKKKEVPTVELINYNGNAVIRCTLVTSEEDNRIPHVHNLIKKQEKEIVEDFYEIEVSAENGYTAEFHGMNIVHTTRKYMRDTLVRKKEIEAVEKWKQMGVSVRKFNERELTKIKEEAKEEVKTMNLNSVTLCFQAFYRNKNGVLQKITDPVYSLPIKNLKSALSGELRICRIDKFVSSCKGSEDVFILVEKVNRNNIKIKFYESDESGNEIWSDHGQFLEQDIHHQYAIIFRTPPYKDTNITCPKDVYIKLERLSDGECSNSVRFTYEPSETIQEKRIRTSASCSERSELEPLQSVKERTDLNNILESMFHFSKELNSPIADIDPNFLDEYENLIENEAGNIKTDEQLQTSDDSSFANDVLLRILDIMSKNPSDAKNKIMDLLKELTKYGDTPLHAALRYNQTDMIKSLLIILAVHSEFKSLVNVRNNFGKTPLHYAVMQNRPEVVKVLLILGADPNVRDEKNCTSLHEAIILPERGACMELIISAKLKLKTPLEEDLHLAARAGSLDAIKSLINAGADENSTTVKCGRTVLHIAVKNGHKDIVRFLVQETKIDVDKRNFNGNTAYQNAKAMNGSRAKEICELLILSRIRQCVRNN